MSARVRTDVDAQIGYNLCALRQKRGLTQRQVADAIGVSYQQIQKYEAGINSISAPRLCDLADALDVSITEFFKGL